MAAVENMQVWYNVCCSVVGTCSCSCVYWHVPVSRDWEPCLQVVYLAWFVIESREVWEAGTLDDVGIPQNYNEGQFWVERVALWTGTDFLITAPFLFAFVARGSLVNSYFGVSYGTIVKWHRCALADLEGKDAALMHAKHEPA